MQYSMFLDDLREPSKEYDVIARSFEEAIEIISKKGIPSHIVKRSAKMGRKVG